jgi:hypothetical protein
MIDTMRRAGLIFALVLSVLACSESRPIAPTAPKPLRFGLGGRQAGKLPGPPGLPAQIIAELAEPESDVRFVRNGARGLLVARRHGRWLAGQVAVGTKRGAVAAKDAAQGLHDIAPAPADATPSALAAFGDGFALTWVQAAQAGDELWALAIAPDGSARGAPRKLTRAFEPIRWVELYEGDGQLFAVWEVKSHDASDLVAAAWTRERVSEPQVLARGVAGWHGAAGRQSAAIAWVTPGEKARVHARVLDATGAARAPVALTTTDGALVDVQVAPLDQRFAIAWTDTSGSDANVHLALLAGDGSLGRAAQPMLDPIGGQALVSLVASSDKKRALLAWERESAPASGRTILMGIVDADAKLSAERAQLEIASGDAPHIVNDGQGFAALTLAPMRAEGVAAGDAPDVPTYVRLDARLGVRAAEPVRVDLLAKRGGVVAGVPRSVRTLECDGGVCTVVARGDGRPALLMLVTLPARATTWHKPARRLPPPQPPLALALDAVGDFDQPIADMSAAKLADGRTLIAWITHPTSAPQGAQPSPANAVLSFRFIDAEGKPGPVQTLSKRAISIGGVEVIALPGGTKGRGVALVAWAGPSNNDAQVYLTSLDANGKSEKQKTVTKITRRQRSTLPNEVFDVTVAPDGQGGFVCAWSDTRDGDLEIYAARVDAELEKRKGDRRVTSRPGPSTEASLRVAGDRALLLWSDAGDGDARADIYIAALDRTSLEIVLPAKRLEATAAHSRTPRWSAGSAAALWIEEPLADTQDARGELRLLAVSDGGEPITAARRVRLPSGAPITSAVVGCDANRCRGIIAGSGGNSLEMGGFAAPRESGAPVRAQSLTVLAGGTAQDLLLTTADSGVDQAFFTQDARRAGSARLRRLRLRW